MQTIDGLYHNLNSGIETKRVVGAGQVIIDRFRDTDHGVSFFI